MRPINQVAKKTFDELSEGLVKVGDNRKIENEGYMPLSIEVINTYGQDEGVEISFCHYSKQEEDLMRDPEMIFIKHKNGNYYPYYFRNDYLGIEEFTVEFAPDGSGIESYFPQKQRQQAIFAGQWAATLREQGFVVALQTERRESLRRAEATQNAESEHIVIEPDEAFLRTVDSSPAARAFAKAEGMI